MSNETRNKINNYSKMTNEALKKMNEDSKNVSDNTLKREKDKEFQDINLLLKNEAIDDSRDGGLNPYDNTPSKKANKIRAFSLTNSAHSTKLLEKLVQGQADNEFTRATLAYQETSLKLLEEIRSGITDLSNKGSKSEETDRVELQREISSLATAIAELNVPALFKELKKGTIRTFDKSGILSNIEMFYGLISESMGDSSMVKSMVKKKFKDGVLNHLFGKNGAYLASKFEDDPLNAIQDFINNAGNSKNQFIRSLFGKNVRGVEIKKPSKTRDDMEEVKSLSDKLTYNTINYRLPETLDRILSAITGEEKKSYDYATNKYLTDYQKLNDKLSSSKLLDLRTASDDLLESLKDKMEDLFDDGKINIDQLSNFVSYDRKSKSIIRNANGKIKTSDDRALSEVMLAITKSKADLNMLAGNTSVLQFMRSNNIRVEGLDNSRVVRALQQIQQMINASGKEFSDDLDSEMFDIRERVSNMNFMDSEFANLSKDQASALALFKRNRISKSEFMKAMQSSPNTRYSGIGFNQHFGPNRYSPTGFTLNSNNEFVSGNQTADNYTIYKSINKVFKPTKNATNIALNGAELSTEREYQNKLNTLLNNNAITKSDLVKIGLVDGSPFNLSKSKKLIDEAELKFAKATEVFNYFFDAGQTPIQLFEKTGQSIEFWKSEGYPSSPSDLYKYIKILPDGTADVDYDTLSKKSLNFSESYIKNLKSKFKVNNEGVDIDIFNPGKGINTILNNTFKDPEVNKRLGLKTGSAAGFVLGKLMQHKGMISSPYAPYIMGGLGGALLNMESVQKRINAVLGPDGDIKGESGYTNREIALAKFMNKTLPALGAGTYVTKNVMKVFKGTGLLGSTFGLLSGGLLGMTAGIVAPKLMEFGREKLFGDDGNGNKGFIKGVGDALRNISWIEKYFGMSTRAGDSDAMLISQTLGEMIYEIETEINEFSGKNLSVTESKQLKALIKLRDELNAEKINVLKDSYHIKRKSNESDEDFKNRVKDFIIKKFERFSAEGAKRGDKAWESTGSDFINKFKEKLEHREEIRDTQRETGRNISDYDIDYNIRNRRITQEIEKITDKDKKERISKILNEASDISDSGDYKSLVEVLMNELDPDGYKKESVTEFNKYLNEKFYGDGDYAASNVLDETDISLLKQGDIDGFIDRISKDQDKLDLMSELSDIGYLSKDFLNSKDVSLIKEVAKIQARAQSNNPDEDGNVDARAEEIAQTLIKMMNKKSFEYKMSETSRTMFGKLKESLAKITGDTGVLDGEDRQAELEILKVIQNSNILKNEKLANKLEEISNKNLQENLELAEEDEESGSGSSNVKMKDLKKYKFKNGVSLDQTGCSIATLNNTLIDMKFGSVNINDLIRIANKYLQSDGSISIDFYKEVALRMGVDLTIYYKKDGSLNESTIKSIKPSASTGIILLKANPETSYGHFVEWCKPNAINDPETPGLTTVTNADILLMSDVMLVFKRKNDKIKSGVNVSKESANKSSTGFINKVTDSISSIFTNRSISNKSNSLSNLSSLPTSSDKTGGLLDSLASFFKENIVNVRLVDDLMLPLKLSDGKMSKYIGDRRKKVNGDLSHLSNLYDKARETTAFKSEFAKADAVQDAILKFSSSGSGSAVIRGFNRNNQGINNLVDGSYEEGSSSSGGSLIGDLITGGLGLGAFELIKSKFKKKTGEEVAKGSLKSVANRQMRRKMQRDLAKKLASKSVEEVTEQSISKGGSKLIPRLVKGFIEFIRSLISKAPYLLKKFLVKFGSTSIFKFIEEFVTKFVKFTSSAKTLIAKRMALSTTKTIATAIPVLDLATAIVSFALSFITGYREAPELLGVDKSNIGVLEKSAVGFAKGFSVAVPGFVIYKFAPFAAPYLGAAYEIFMDTIGFKMIVSWFLQSGNEDNLKETQDISVENYSKEEKSLMKEETKKDSTTVNKTESSLGASSNDSKNSLNVSKESDNKSTSYDLNNTESKKGFFSSIKDTLFSGQTSYSSYYNTSFSDNSTSIKPDVNPSDISIADEVKKEAISEVKKTIKDSKNFLEPLSGTRRINSAFGPRYNPSNGKYQMHNGIDLAGQMGEPVSTIKSGTVISIDKKYGTVKVKHEDGLVTGYTHLSKINVRKGDNLKAGEIVGLVGGMGPRGVNTYAPHLHLSTIKNGQYVDPLTTLGMDPNRLKLTPKSAARENLDYLVKHKDLIASLDSSKKEQFYDNIGGTGKGSDDSSYNISDEFRVPITELANSIKGLSSILPVNTKVSPTEAINTQILTSINNSFNTMLQLLQTQVAQTQQLINSIQGLKVNPEDYADIMSTKLTGGIF